MSVLRLAIPSPLRRLFDYLPPSGMSSTEIGSLQAGVRLRVPFGRREVTGYLLAVCSESEIPMSSLKPALEVLDQTPLIDPQLLKLCHWAADYYHHPLGEVYNTLFPKRLREGHNQSQSKHAKKLEIDPRRLVVVVNNIEIRNAQKREIANPH